MFDSEVWDNFLTIDELQSKYPVVPWDEYFKNTIKSELEPTDQIVVLSPSFLRNLSTLLDKTPKRVLANYLSWRVVKDSAETLSKKIRETYREFEAVMSSNHNKHMWQDCVDHVNTILYLATGSLYVRRHFSEKSKDSASEVIVDLKKNFQNLLNEVFFKRNFKIALNP